MNLTYSQIDLSVSDPQGSLQTISIIPGGDSATMDFLELQNVSQTLALSTLESGSEIVSVTFVVTRIEIAINGTISPVSLATGGSALVVSISNSSPLQGTTNALLLELNPTVMNSTSGYELVPSSLGILKPPSEITAMDARIGYTHGLSDEDKNNLHQMKGSISAELTSLSVSGNMTTINIQVINTGKNPERLVLFGIYGSFNIVCPTTWNDADRRDRGSHCNSYSRLREPYSRGTSHSLDCDDGHELRVPAPEPG